jgi:hypothetical protein
MSDLTGWLEQVVNGPSKVANSTFGKVMSFVLMGGAAAALYLGHQETERLEQVRTRVDAEVAHKSLTRVTMGYFAKSKDCPDDLPYRAHYTAQGPQKEYLEGNICASPTGTPKFVP